jgi:tetratricopeptide (TPR) repeat protein
MTPERWRQVRTVFDSALELSDGGCGAQPGSAMDEFLRRACAGDAALYEEARVLLERHRRSGILDRPPLAPAFDPPTAPSGDGGGSGGRGGGTATGGGAGGSGPPIFHQGQMVAGRYRIVRYLSHGGMGEVYEAQDLDLELAETIALKTLRPDISGDESMIARFKQEIALSRKVAHPNVCRMFDLFRHEGESSRPIVFLTMEFLPGETLAARLKREGAMSEAEALPLLQQMGAALDASHAAGVIHRDFKPSNVMLVPSASGLRAVVTDFGLARRFVASDASTTTMSKGLMGTLDYMAPELLTGAMASFASDIYALGMTAYKMMAGSLPFGGDTPLAAAVARIHRPVPSPRASQPGLDPRWERAILRALDPEPARRFSSASRFAAAFSGDPSSAVKLPVMTRRRAAVAAIAAMCAIGAGLAWGEWMRGSPRLPARAQALYAQGAADVAAGAYFAATKALDQASQLAPQAAQIHARLAEAWLELELPEKAGEEMLLARRQDLSALPKLDRLRVEGIDLGITREYPAAVAKYEEIAREGGPTPELDVDLGRAYERAGQPDKAMASYKKAAESAEPIPAAWLHMGELYKNQSNKQKSDEAFAEAERLYQLTSNLEGLTEVAVQEGFAATSRGELEAGSAYLHKALETARLANNPQQEIVATLRLSTNAYLAGDTEGTERYANAALEMARANQLDAMAIRGLVYLGNAFIRKQDFDRAEQYYRDALNLARQSHATRLAALSLASLASLHDQKQDYAQSVKEAKEALAFYQPNGFAKETTQCLTLIARAQRASGDYEGALSSFRAMLQAAEKAQDRFAMASLHESIGGTLFQQTRYPEALEEYRKSLSAATDAEQTGYANLNCGRALWHLGRYAEAVEAFAKVDPIAGKLPRLGFTLQSERAGMLLSQGRYRTAMDLAKPVLAQRAAQTPGLQTILSETLGLAQARSGNKREGLKKCEEAQITATKLAAPDDIASAGAALLEAQIVSGERESATRLFHGLEPQLAAFPELRWRALALFSRVDSVYSAPAREALEKILRLWGEPVYTTYLTRPDIEKLSGPLLRPASAIHTREAEK